MSDRHKLGLAGLLLLGLAYSFSGFFFSGTTITIPRGKLLLGVRKTPFDQVLLRNAKYLIENPKVLRALPSPQNQSLEKNLFSNQYEIRNKDYDLFLQALTGHSFCHPNEPIAHGHNPKYPSRNLRNFSQPLQPVTWINWWDAYALCHWLGGRLPTDDEWERLARYTDGRLFPWGNRMGNANAMIGKPNTGRIQHVGYYPLGRSVEGLYDLVGNVKEWTMGLARVEQPGIRGGGPFDFPADLFSLTMMRGYIENRNSFGEDIGCRCVFDTRPVLELLEEDSPQRVILEENPPLEITKGIYMTGVPPESKLFANVKEYGMEPFLEFFHDKTAELDIASFQLDKTEVTNIAYGRFLRHFLSKWHFYCHPNEPNNKSHIPLFWQDSTLSEANKPVVGVDWWDAYAYANWTGKRLPTAEEWEFALEGELQNNYAWGDEYIPRAANFAQDSLHNWPSLPGAYATDQNQFGVVDLSGNVSEWTGIPSNQNGNYKAIIKGGNYLNNGVLRGTNFYQLEASLSTRDMALGFRCAKDQLFIFKANQTN